MKRRIRLAHCGRLPLAIALVLWIAQGAGVAAAQGIVGSKHDFTVGIGNGWYTSDQICVACHTPHNADQTVPGSPLWNHEVTAATFVPYSSLSLDAVPGQPDGTSKLCLSCHDGTVALDSWGGTTGTIIWPGGHSDVLNTDLTNDHPFSFVYDDALAATDEHLAYPTSAPSGLGGTITEDLLDGSKVQCNSCHDVHDVNGIEFLLVMDNTASALCLTCHLK